MGDYLDPARLENLDYDALMKRALATEPDSFLDAFAVLNAEWMREQLRIAREHGDDPRALFFYIDGALHPSLEGFELDQRKVIRREELQRVASEEGWSLVEVAKAVAGEHLPGHVPVVISVGERVGVRSLELYAPAAVGTA